MINTVRRFARLGLNKCGLKRIRHPDIADIIRHHKITTVLDVGANDGFFGSELRDAGYKGHIISFEPIQGVFERLKNRTANDPLWEAHNFALGDVAGEQVISVSNSDVFSSLKPPSEYAASIWEGIHEKRKENIRVERLDNVLLKYPDYARDAYLKIDTQGFEFEVLRGAGNHLRQFRCVQAELAFRPLYNGQASWTSLIDWMADQGFFVCAAKENGVDWGAMRLVEMDFVFERSETASPYTA